MNTGLVLALLKLTWITFTEGITEFRCTNTNSNDTQVLTLKCPPNLFINVQEALYGRNQWNECKFFVGDCTELFNIDTQCCGRNDCSLVIRKIYSTKCSAYVSFFRVIYECEAAEQSTCSIKGTNSLTSERVTNTEISNVLPPTSPDVVSPTIDSDGVPKDVYIIIGSAATVAFLLAAIITVIFFLRKYQWQGEKQCILELFVGWFKRHPPDGCENPADSPKKGASTTDIHQISTVSSASTSDNSQIKSETKQGNVPKQNNQFKNTSLYHMIKQVTNSYPRASNGKIILEKSTSPVDHTTIDVIHSEIVQESAISVNNNEEMCSDNGTHGQVPDVHKKIRDEQQIFTDV